MSALSNKQKWILSAMAERAFRLIGAKVRGSFRTGTGDEAKGPFAAGQFATLQETLDALAANGSAACLETWRHEQVRLAVGKGGLRLCDQLDYSKVEAHFQALLGEDGKALKADVRSASESRRQMEYNVDAACQRWGFQLSYAEAICRAAHHVSLQEADARTLRMVLYTINNRGAARRRKQQEGVTA
jgi:hypothetical protein